MDADLIFKLGSLIIGAIATGKVVVELLRGRQGHLREEYRFAPDFFSHLQDAREYHPFLREKGFQAIAGDTSLSAAEIEYILTLHNSPRALKDYILGEPYIQHLSTSSGDQIIFRKKYTRNWSRRWRKGMYLLLYGACFFAAFLPVAVPTFRAAEPEKVLSAFIFTALLFLPAAFLALRAGVRIARAEKLVNSQFKHAKGIMLS